MQPSSRSARLSEADRARLAKLLGMIGSANEPEEALVAAKMADQFVRARKLRWADVIAAPYPTNHITHALHASREAAAWFTEAEACVRLGTGVLSEADIAFCRSLLTFPRISSKQRAILCKIADKLALAMGGVS